MPFIVINAFKLIALGIFNFRKHAFSQIKSVQSVYKFRKQFIKYNKINIVKFKNKFCIVF